MSSQHKASRRIFLKQTSLGLGGSIAGASMLSFRSPGGKITESAREISVATIDLIGLQGDATRESRLRRVIRRMEELSGLRPDIMCLPQHFDSIWLDEGLSIKEAAEDEKVPGPVTSRLAEFAGKHNCYVACPIYTKNEGRFYSSSLLIDRKGNIAGVYHKIHPAKSEILLNGPFGEGITPGSLRQPIIETDFGKVGMQISDDVFWNDGWDNLKAQGANVILFSSDFSGGMMLNYYALRNSSYLISGTATDARIIDVSGNDLHASSTFVRYGWASINLQRVNIGAWPTNGILRHIFSKYGNRLKIKVWEGNGVMTLENNDPNLSVSDVLKEFKIRTLDELYTETETVQRKYRL